MNFGYQKHCILSPVMPSVMFGSLFTAIGMAQGVPFSPPMAALNIGGIYAYNVLQCPMVAIHGRESAWHNTASGAILGYVGVQSRVLGIPFVDESFFWRNPQVPRPMVGALIYGGITTAFAMLSDKKF